MQNSIVKKSLVIGIFSLFLGAGFTSVIGISDNSEEDVSTFTFYTFDRTGTRKCKVELEPDVIEEISDMFKDLKDKLTCDPTSDTTQQLKNDFVDLIETYGLINNDISKDHVFSNLKPRWLNWFDGNSPLNRNSFFSFLGSRLKNRYVLGSYPYTSSAFFCSMTSEGFGLMFPPAMIPRPRIATVWASFLTADTLAANLITGHGFTASGSQYGMALGFMGIGISFAIPGLPAYYGFSGYALYTMVSAEEITTYPM